MNDLVSIITPNFNSEKFISETIISVQKQTYTNWEMIIVDDFSTDNSINIINSFRNKAITLSRGKFIAFLDSDDLWLPKKLELQLKFMIKNNYSLTYTSYEVINEEGNTKLKTILCKTKLNYKMMLSSNKIGCLTAMYNTELIGKVLMPEIRKRQDYGLWLKILKTELASFFLTEIRILQFNSSF